MSQGKHVSTRRLEAAIISILREQHPATVRYPHYGLLSFNDALVREVHQNTRGCYQRVSKIITDLRREGRIPWEWIVDKSRPTYTPSVWQDPKDYGKTIKCAYRKDYWQDQPVLVEIWSEKDTVSGVIAPVTDELGVTVRVGRGFDSTTGVHNIADHFQQVTKPKRVFYIGDHDPDGRAIEQSIRQRVLELGSGSFAMSRLAINVGDIKRFNLPPMRIKRFDDDHEKAGLPKSSRAKAFLKKYRDETVELDALPPDVLRRRVKRAIEELIDWTRWNRAINAEEAELESIEDFVSKWPGNSRSTKGHRDDG
jgi:hypothetical protein